MHCKQKLVGLAFIASLAILAWGDPLSRFKDRLNTPGAEDWNKFHWTASPAQTVE